MRRRAGDDLVRRAGDGELGDSLYRGRAGGCQQQERHCESAPPHLCQAHISRFQAAVGVIISALGFPENKVRPGTRYRTARLINLSRPNWATLNNYDEKRVGLPADSVHHCRKPLGISVSTLAPVTGHR